jgi:mono/diheme cytochrome c family protein
VAGALIYLMISFSPAPSAPLPQTHQPQTHDLAEGRELYNQNCAVCHGADGKAKTERAAAMKTPPADLTALSGMTEAEIYQVITDGIAASEMPSFKNRLSKEQRQRIAMFVQTLQQPAASAQTPHQHDHHPPADSQNQGHTGHSAMTAMMNTVTGGPYRSMRAIGSGTALQPASTPMWMWMWMPGEWMLMLHSNCGLALHDQPEQTSDRQMQQNVNDQRDEMR